jgi:uncharacterized protein
MTVSSVGLSRHHGGPVSGFAHVVECFGDLLSTVVGARVLRRDYGSDVPLLIDREMTPQQILLVITAVADAADLWEPRLVVRRCTIIRAERTGRLGLRLIVDYYPRGHLGDRTTVERMREADVFVR